MQNGVDERKGGNLQGHSLRFDERQPWQLTNVTGAQFID
jgi:hypothetical protein